MTRLSLALGAVLIASSVGVALAAPLPPGGTFTDDNGNVHEGFIEAIAAEGITRGCNPPINDRYCPSSFVERGQMAAFLVRALDLTDDGGKDWFTDDDGTTFEADINKLATAGITAGCNPPDNDRFCPDGSVTRGQMAAFLVRAYEYTDAGKGDWFVDDDGTVFEADIDRLATAGITLGCNPPANDRYCPGDLVRRDQMASFLGRAEGLTPMVPPPVIEPSIETVVTGLSRPVWATSPEGDDRLFVLEKSGYVRIVENDALQSGAFLDINDLVSGANEQGLLGLAFHPDYASNGLFYVSYTDTGGDSRIVEYQVSGNPNRADEASARLILEVDQPANNHNGGMITFAPDGYLLFGLGDGGGGGDPWGNGQNKNTLLGSMLRIGIDGDDFPGDANRNYTIPADNPFVGSSGADEIWAYGLRNPWRFSIDETADLLYIGDVGQGAWEEVDVTSISDAGLNYGWNELEGNHCYPAGSSCDATGTVPATVEYSHSYGCSVTGGYVYRGSEFPDLVGHYFYADYCAGDLLSFKYDSGAVSAERNWTSELGKIGSATSFAVDNEQRLYILNESGRLLRLAPSS
jgi:glucose/arabinose dehydrogenase